MRVIISLFNFKFLMKNGYFKKFFEKKNSLLQVTIGPTSLSTWENVTTARTPNLVEKSSRYTVLHSSRSCLQV